MHVQATVLQDGIFLVDIAPWGADAGLNSTTSWLLANAQRSWHAVHKDAEQRAPGSNRNSRRAKKLCTISKIREVMGKTHCVAVLRQTSSQRLDAAQVTEDQTKPQTAAS